MGAERRYDAVNADEEWQKLCARGLSFPPYHGPSQLRGIRGDCLYPLLIEGQHAIRCTPMTPDEPIVDGGLYMLDLGNSAHNSEAEAYRAKHGLAPRESFVIAKFLRWVGFEWYAVCKDSLVSLNEYGPVLAMVVAVLPLTGCAP